jgi:hypothetical protein
MRKRRIRFGLSGDLRPCLDLVPNELREAAGVAGSSLDPVGLRIVLPGEGSNKSTL